MGFIRFIEILFKSEAELLLIEKLAMQCYALSKLTPT